MELRCPAKVLFAVVSDDAFGTIEFKCRGKWCGHRTGVVVIHVFDLATGEVTETRKFRDPIFNKERDTRKEKAKA